MPDIIKLLPDSVANQIAAGEVVQRPGSVVKELMENAIDAGATDIKLIIRDAGKTLIQVVDNGCGMSETDARLSFERHATSKIQEAKDLFAIRTMGFRGEALASIAAIAQVELKTKRIEDELGTSVIVEGSEVIKQEACSCTNGTSISIKNLFFNVPARRNFLKSNPVETSHIIEEFHRITLAYPKIAFSMYHNDKEIYKLSADSNLKQRIAGIFGSNYNQRLIPVEQKTDFITIYGYIGKPEYAKKTRGEQYFFVNNRYIKHPYLHHSVNNAFTELLSSSAYPTYFIYFDVDPNTIDINIHPTKTEIKFQDDKIIYAVLRSTVKLSLGKYNITPSIDFDVERSFDLPHSYKDKPVIPPTIKINPNYNPFDNPKGNHQLTPLKKSNKENWEKLFEKNDTDINLTTQSAHITIEQENQQTVIDKEWEKDNKDIIAQLHNSFILVNTKSGLLVIDQQNAHERILYEHFFNSIENHTGISQQQLFPQKVEFSASDAELLKELSDEIKLIGFDITEFGSNTFVINGIPTDMPEENAKETLEGFLENYKKNLITTKSDRKTNLAKSMAKNISIKAGKSLKKDEMTTLINELFACNMPQVSPEGKPTYITITIDELETKFKKSIS